MSKSTRSKEAEIVLGRVRRKMKAWGITISYLARQVGVSRQYGWQMVHHSTLVSPNRAAELDRTVDALIQARKHLGTFGQRLRAARVAAGFTLKEVASLIGYSWVGVERWERDVCLPKPGVLWHLISLYGVGQESFASQRIIDMGRPEHTSAGHGGLRLPYGAREELALSLRALGSFPMAARQNSRSAGSSSVTAAPHGHKRGDARLDYNLR